MRNLGTQYTHPLYNTWRKIKQKSKNDNSKSIPNSWESFNNFIKDLPDKPKGLDKYVLKRIDKYSSYSKNNIHWVKVKCNTHNTNKINTSSNTTETKSVQVPRLF